MRGAMKSGLHREVNANREVASRWDDSQKKGTSSKERKWVDPDEDTLGVTKMIG